MCLGLQPLAPLVGLAPPSESERLSRAPSAFPWWPPIDITGLGTEEWKIQQPAGGLIKLDVMMLLEPPGAMIKNPSRQCRHERSMKHAIEHLSKQG